MASAYLQTGDLVLTVSDHENPIARESCEKSGEVYRGHLLRIADGWSATAAQKECTEMEALELVAAFVLLDDEGCPRRLRDAWQKAFPQKDFNP